MSDAKRIAAFTAWLSTQGASVMKPTSEWELVRYTGEAGLSVVYTKKNGRWSFTGDSFAAWEAFCRGDNTYRATPKTKRKKKSGPMVAALRARDGDDCFYCLGHVDESNASVEHLLSVTHGGPDHISNAVLAHKLCNSKAGHKSLMEKIRIHTNAVLRNRPTKIAKVQP